LQKIEEINIFNLDMEFMSDISKLDTQQLSDKVFSELFKNPMSLHKFDEFLRNTFIALNVPSNELNDIVFNLVIRYTRFISEQNTKKPSKTPLVWRQYTGLRKIFDLEDYTGTYRESRDAYLKASKELELATRPYKMARDAYIRDTTIYTRSIYG